MKKYNFVYLTTFNDGRYYIGQHKTDKLDDGYFGSSKLVRELIKEGFVPKREILRWCENQKELNYWEKMFIGDRWKNDELCLNENNTCGITEESPMKGKQAWNKGIHKTDEQKKKQSDSMKGKMKGEKNPMYGRIGEKHPMYGKIGPNKGKHHSEEHKRKLAEAIKGKHRVYDNPEKTKWHME